MYSFSSFIFFLRKTLGDRGCPSPASFSSFPSHRGCALALPGHHSSSLESPPWGHHAAFAPLSSSNRWALTLWYLKRNSGAPGTLYFFSPQRRTLPVLHTSFWSSRSSSCPLPVFSRWITTACCFLVPPKQFEFFFGFFTRQKPLQGLQLSWHPSVLTERPFFPRQSFPAPFCL